MAKKRSIAISYLGRIDPGLALSSDQVEQWSAVGFAESHVRDLCDRHLVLTWQRVKILEVEKAGWWEKCRSALRPSISNLCSGVLEKGMPDPVLWGGLDKSELTIEDVNGESEILNSVGDSLYVLPKKGTAEAKRLALAAIALDPLHWIKEWVAEMEYFSQYVPTIAQAALQYGSTEVTSSSCNKLIARLDVEAARVLSLQEQLEGWR